MTSSAAAPYARSAGAMRAPGDRGSLPVPMVLGIILGPIAEFGLFEALSISDHGAWIFFMRIPSLIIFLCILTVIFWPFIDRLYKKPRVKTGC